MNIQPTLRRAARACTMVSTMATLLVTLSACGGAGSGSNPVSSAASGSSGTGSSIACADLAPTNHSARSLPVNVSPRPGPAVLYEAPPRAPQLENVGIWQAPPILISGASAYRCGEFMYQDWLYDDRGAAGQEDAQNPHNARSFLFSPTAGTLSYPTDPVLANNAADIVEFRIKPLPDATAIRVTLNTLQDAQRMALTIALGDSNGLRDWPHAASTASPAQYFVTVHGEVAEILDATDGTALSPAPTVSIDTLRRQVDIRIPHAVWEPACETVRIAAAAGLWDTVAQSYLQPGLTANAATPGGAAVNGAALFNVAFRANELITEFPPNSGRTIVDAAADAKLQGKWWRERAQADALALGNISNFFAEVDFAKLADGINDESGVPQSGHMNRIFASRFEFGQGMDYNSACGGISAARPCDGTMVGQLQPYALYVPEQPEPASGYGLTLLLHALSANYNQYLGTRHARQFGERNDGTIVMTPAGRGPDGFYFDVAEADTFEVWADVARHYPLNPDSVAMSGVSMGGIGAFRLAVRYPDLFARFMPIVAGAPLISQFPSLRNLPVMMWTSTLDELQPIRTTEATVSALDALDLRYDVLRFETWDHLTPSTNDFYAPGAEFLGPALIERNPARVTYVLAPAEDEPRVRVNTEGAYWLSDMTLRDNTLDTGTIDVRSEGFGVDDAPVLPVEMSSAILTGGNQEPAPYTRRVRDSGPPETAPVRDRLVITAENVATVTINPERAQVSCAAQLDITSDGPLSVRLSGCN